MALNVDGIINYEHKGIGWLFMYSKSNNIDGFSGKIFGSHSRKKYVNHM